jgi:hypothetical protein
LRNVFNDYGSIKKFNSNWDQIARNLSFQWKLLLIFGSG